MENEQRSPQTWRWMSVNKKDKSENVKDDAMKIEKCEKTNLLEKIDFVGFHYILSLF